MRPSVVAVDWSGDAHLARSRIFLAEATEPGRLIRLECGYDRADLTCLIVANPPTVLGLDFGFSYPCAFVHSLGVATAPDLWQRATDEGERWLSECAPPFWGRPGHPRPTPAAYRRTEIAVPRINGVAPKSMFQIGGAGAVGTGSIRGMPFLSALHLAGATIWPYTVQDQPMVVEIYPRLLTGPVHKSRPAARRAVLDARFPALDAEFREIAIASEDAFDAAVSALVMIEHVDDLLSLPIELDPELRLEGRIWHPAWRADRA